MTGYESGEEFETDDVEVPSGKYKDLLLQALNPIFNKYQVNAAEFSPAMLLKVHDRLLQWKPELAQLGEGEAPPYDLRFMEVPNGGWQLTAVDRQTQDPEFVFSDISIEFNVEGATSLLGWGKLSGNGEKSEVLMKVNLFVQKLVGDIKPYVIYRTTLPNDLKGFDL